MGICGSVGFASGTLSRVLSSLGISARRPLARRHPGDAELGACDDGTLACDPARILVFDGRIDNAGELLRALSLPGREGQDNAAIALAAYEKWGADFCDHIVGDYACAVWDGRRLVMATDPGALRTLFFWADGNRILFASEQRGLWAHGDVPRELDPDQMAAWLSMLPREPLRTFFRGIRRVPPGQRVIWEAGRVRLERWWRPEELPTLRLKRDEEYEDALREALDEAVRCRIGAGERIGATLSGGLDSSSVTALAARHLAAGGHRLVAFTAAPDHAAPGRRGRFTDEWPHAAAVAGLYPNIEHVRVANDDAPLLDALALREAGNDWPVMNASNTVWMNGIDRAAKERRLQVMLMGAMGNMTISHRGDGLLAGQLRSANLIGALRTMMDMRRGAGRSWLSFASEAAWAFLPPRARRGLWAAMGRREIGLFDFSAIRPDFLRRSGLEGRAMDIAANLRNLTGGDSRALRLAALDRSDHRGHWAMGTRRLYGLDIRDPTSDRRLIDLCLSIPEEQYARGGVPRSLIRRAMKGILPDVVLEERRKGLQAADWRVGFQAALPALREEVGRLRASPFASECLDLDRMEALLDAWPGPDDTNPETATTYLSAFSRGLTAGRFIRRVEGGNG